ncbi:hypothetical protein CBS63078_9191 [Aspergillus niger]|nr:hypothetical protein CBS13152_9478 [Aspergillus niger]KAI3192172.1 hypothetical protein CBS147311_9333 [Penicillium roqueforti]GLA78619.1 hypothetical protein AtubIFM55763_011633 [Aspergillus tubingensis]KAI2891929.1 hypothetical protein CBS11852_5936 [Aspergillus niger]KAI2893150.1 hypothetical protein CBS63078_9191 [Aspergillus niger]
MSESQPPSQSRLTTLLVGNLHCPSCVATVQETLTSLRPAPFSISTSIVLHEIKVFHPITLSASRIAHALEDAGFELDSIVPSTLRAADPEAHDYTPRSSSRRHGGAYDVHCQSKTHVRQCDACSAQLGTLSSTEDLQASSSGETLTSVIAGHISGFKYRVSLAISGMSCSSCVGKITTALQGRPWIVSLDVNLLTSSAVVVLLDRAHVDEVLETIRRSGYTVDVVDIEEVRPQRAAKGSLSMVDSWRASYIIEGMSCSSCVGKVTDTLNQHEWITKVDVNLVASSATVEYQGKDHLEDISKIIGELGYMATLSDVESRDPSDQPNSVREIQIQIDGIHCDNCPQRVVDALASAYSGQVEVLELLTNGKPQVKVRYLPNAPNRTIRRIMRTISDVDPTFTVSIYHPPTLEERSHAMHRRNQWQIARRLILAVIIALPTFIIGIVYMSLVPYDNPGKKYLMEPLWAGQASRGEWALFILATPVYFYSAGLFHRKTAHEVYSLWRPGSKTPILRRFLRFGSMDMLMSLGTTIAYFASIAILVINATQSVDAKTYHTESFFDSVVFLTMFLMIGRLLEAYSKAKAGDAVGLLGKLRPTEAVLIEQPHGDQAEVTRTLPIDQLEIGDVVRVANGASPPYDGIIINGASRFDESSLTGESRPVEKSVGDEVLSGTINQADPVQMKITRLSDSMLDQVIGAVREGQIRRAPIERTADLLTSYFVPVVTLIAVLDWIIWLALGLAGLLPEAWQDGPGGWEFWSLQFAISVFVVACPCGIGLAAPTALFVGGGLAAQHGILVKGGGEAFQEASQLDCVVFDKTGTITEGGQPSITNHVVVHEGNHLGEIWGAVLELEQNSSHPIAKAMVSFATDQQPSGVKIITVNEIAGKGLKGLFTPVNQDTDSRFEMIVGNEALMRDHNIDVSSAHLDTLMAWKYEAKSVVLVGTRTQATTAPDHTVPWQLSIMLAVADPVRPEAPSVLRALRNRGVDVWMISGDNPTTAHAVGKIVGIPAENIIAGVLPEQKAQKVRYLQQTLQKPTQSGWFGGKKAPSSARAIVAMVGDGINDSPALTAADVGIAIGSGSDIAISAAEFVLVSSGLTSLLILVDLSRVVFRRIKFNFAWALVYNCIAVPVAAGVLYPIVSNGKHVRLDPVWASLAMALSSVSVICSSLLMRTRLPWVGFRAKQ